MAEKSTAFRELHHRGRTFAIPNPYNAGTARLLEHLGFEALATSSAGFAFQMGRPDYGLTRELAIAHCAEIVDATGLPVSADLENGFGRTPAEVAGTYRLAAATGLCGASIEDSSGDPSNPILDVEAAADRVRAAAETVHALDRTFVLTGRAENYLHGRPDLAGTIARLQAYQEAGADVLYAPGLTRAADIAAVVRSVDRPVNLLIGLPGGPADLGACTALGIARASTGSFLTRAALNAFMTAAIELRDAGTFSFAAPPHHDFNGIFRAG